MIERYFILIIQGNLDVQHSSVNKATTNKLTDAQLAWVDLED